MHNEKPFTYFESCDWYESTITRCHSRRQVKIEIRKIKSDSHSSIFSFASSGALVNYFEFAAKNLVRVNREYQIK